MITVSIVKDDKLIREALKDLINEADGFECIEIYECGAPMSFKIPKLVVSSFQKKTETTLTQREFDVLDQLCMGHSYKEIAYKLLNTVGTVRHHLKIFITNCMYIPSLKQLLKR